MDSSMSAPQTGPTMTTGEDLDSAGSVGMESRAAELVAEDVLDPEGFGKMLRTGVDSVGFLSFALERFRRADEADGVTSSLFPKETVEGITWVKNNLESLISSSDVIPSVAARCDRADEADLMESKLRDIHARMTGTANDGKVPINDIIDHIENMQPHPETNDLRARITSLEEENSKLKRALSDAGYVATTRTYALLRRIQRAFEDIGQVARFAVAIQKAPISVEDLVNRAKDMTLLIQAIARSEAAQLAKKEIEESSLCKVAGMPALDYAYRHAMMQPSGGHESMVKTMTARVLLTLDQLRRFTHELSYEEKLNLVHHVDEAVKYDAAWNGSTNPVQVRGDMPPNRPETLDFVRSIRAKYEHLAPNEAWATMTERNGVFEFHLLGHPAYEAHNITRREGMEDSAWTTEDSETSAPTPATLGATTDAANKGIEDMGPCGTASQRRETLALNPATLGAATGVADKGNEQEEGNDTPQSMDLSEEVSEDMRRASELLPAGTSRAITQCFDLKSPHWKEVYPIWMQKLKNEQEWNPRSGSFFAEKDFKSLAVSAPPNDFTLSRAEIPNVRDLDLKFASQLQFVGKIAPEYWPKFDDLLRLGELVACMDKVPGWNGIFMPIPMFYIEAAFPAFRVQDREFKADLGRFIVAKDEKAETFVGMVDGKAPVIHQSRGEEGAFDDMESRSEGAAFDDMDSRGEEAAFDDMESRSEGAAFDDMDSRDEEAAFDDMDSRGEPEDKSEVGDKSEVEASHKGEVEAVGDQAASGDAGVEADSNLPRFDETEYVPPKLVKVETIEEAIEGMDLSEPPKVMMVEASGKTALHYDTPSRTRSRTLPPGATIPADKVDFSKDAMMNYGPAWTCGRAAAGHSGKVCVNAWPRKACPDCKTQKIRGRTIIHDFAAKNKMAIYRSDEPKGWEAAVGSLKKTGNTSGTKRKAAARTGGENPKRARVGEEAEELEEPAGAMLEECEPINSAQWVQRNMKSDEPASEEEEVEEEGEVLNWLDGLLPEGA